MDSLSPQVEVILNGDSPVSTRVIEGVLQPVAPTTAEQRLARKNELKARGTLLMALLDKHQLKFNSHKDAKTLMEAIEKRFGQDQIHDRLQKLASQLEIHGVSLSQEDVNLKFLCISAAASVSAAYAKLPASPLPNVDSLSNVVIYFFFSSQSISPQLDNKDLKHIDVADLEEIDLRWQMAMLTMWARRSLKDPRRPGATEPQRRTDPVETSTSNALVSQCDGTGGYDWSYQVDEEPANFALMAFSSNSSFDNETGLESVEARLLVYKQNESVFEENIKVLNIEVQLRDTALVTLRHKLEKAEQERDDLKLKLEKFQTSSKNLTDYWPVRQMRILESDCESWPPSNLYDRFQPSGGYHDVPPPYKGTFMPPKLDLVFNTAPTRVETDHLAFNVHLSPTKPEQDLSHTARPSAPIIEDWVSDSEEESKTKAPWLVPSFAQSTEHVKSPRHSVQQIETTILAATPVSASPKSNSIGQRRNRKVCFVCKSVNYLIKDCNYHTKVPIAVLTQSKPVSNIAVRPVSAALPNITVARPRHAHQVVTKFKSPIRRYITRSPSSRTSTSPPRVTTVQAPMVSVVQGKHETWGNPQLALQDKGVIDSGCSRYMIGNMSYLSKFEELNGGYVSFGGNPKGGKITSKGKIKTGKLDFDDVYFVKELKFNLFSISQMCDKKNSVLFTNTECLVLSPDFKFPDENQVLLRVPRENNMYNVNLKNFVPSGDLTCLFAKATINKSNLWHRRLAHINFKTINKLVTGKFQGKVDEGILVGYSVCSKSFRVFNSRTHIIQETLHVNFLENKPNVAGTGPTWLFDIDSLTKTMNYRPVHIGNQTNSGAGFQDNFDAEKAGEEVNQSYMLFLVWSVGSTNPQNNAKDAAFDGKEHDFDVKKPESKVILSPSSSAQSKDQDDITKKEAKGKNASQLPDDSDMPVLEDIINSDDEDVVGAEADFNNLESSIPISPIPTTRIQKDHPEEGIDYKEVFTPVARIEAIRIFLAYALFMGFMVYQMVVKSAFLYGTIEEEVYVCQPLGFKDPDHPDKVYKVVKALYGLHQAPRAWYETLATYLLENGFHRGTIDQTLFIKKLKGDILLVQIYVDDILFGANNKDLCKSFEKLMKEKFQMSSIGELTFFLGLQVKQKKDGIFITQDKYVTEILRKFGLSEGKSASTPIDTEKPLLKNPDGEDIDVHTYRSMIGSLMYLTLSRPNIMFAVCACARFQVTPKALHLHAVKRIFRYLKGKQDLGLWYPKDSPFDLIAYSDTDYVGASLDRKSTTRGCQFLGCRLISWHGKKQTVIATSSIEAEYVAVASCCA
uniref:Putative ribonuclease H-like domain-containing protein n=1 Tax=Tanacetum cinerariifolium TaxID=118510 RepID=A0A699GNY6_TANCI|nr:putative ribonuclease H-like domain-containing protein [Tanacetum cinerariifolium]